MSAQERAAEVLAWFRHGDDGLTGWQRRQAARRYRRIALSPPTARELEMLRQWRAEADEGKNTQQEE